MYLLLLIKEASFFATDRDLQRSRTYQNVENKWIWVSNSNWLHMKWKPYAPDSGKIDNNVKEML